MLIPLSTAAIYYYVFNLVFKVKLDHYLVFILSGTLVWGFINQTIMEGMESIVGGAGLITKVPVPIPVLPFVVSATNIVTLLLAIPILLAVALGSHAPLSSSVALLPLYFLILFSMAYGIALILSVFFVLFRDLRHIMSIVMTIWFYITPVVYDEKMIPERFSWVLYANPFGLFFTHLHSICVRGEWPNLAQFGIILLWAISIQLLAIAVLKYLAEGIVEQI